MSKLAFALGVLAVAVAGGDHSGAMPLGRPTFDRPATTAPGGAPAPDRAAPSVVARPLQLGQLRVAASRRGVDEVVSPAELNARNEALFAQMRELASGGGQRLDSYTASRSSVNRQSQSYGGAIAEQIGAPCPERAPLIVQSKGLITPGGGVGVTGECFGEKGGEVRIYGAFPGGYLVLQNVVWSDTVAAGTVPDVVGVIDQIVSIEVARADGRASPRRRGHFVPRYQESEIVVPAGVIHVDQCYDSADNCMQYGATQAVHKSDAAPGMSGQDDWEVRLAKGWFLTTISIWNDVSSPPLTLTGFDQGPPEFAKFSFHFTTDCSVSKTGWGVGDSGCVQSMAKYSFEIRAIGPVGVLPTPAN